ncbi:MAG TPA: FTR1 family protein [Patescibacteria group bacterium]|nr:FTR1 family protein [Patescibacteria group bacterium]
MLSAAIVIFREVFEIVLIVGIILAATRNVPSRLKAIGLGFGSGIAGATLIAFFTREISEFAEGMGQEIFSAGILFTAALFIGWTVLWMKKHSRDMKAHFTKVGEQVAAGNLPYISLSLIIALAILREGSEIVLFSYGMIASGMSAFSLAAGFAAGMAAGLVVGLALYRGLITFPLKHFFRITSWILMLLVAGMMSQGVGFLIAAGVVNSLAHPLWDSSWLLSDGSIAGQSLKTLIGYTAHPSAIQVIAYIVTLGALLFLTEFSGRVKVAVVKAAATTAGLIIVFWAISANAADKIYAPYVVKGEAEIEWNGNMAFDHRGDRDGAQGHEFEAEYGVTDSWQTILTAVAEKESNGESTDFTELEWENKFQLTEKGEYWLDPGLKVAYIHTLDDDTPDAIEAKILLEKDVGRIVHLANVSFEKEIGHNAEHGTAGGFAWNTRYRNDMYFEPGIEWQSDFGIIGNGSSFSEQEHVIGPSVYGSIIPHVNYQLAWLFGVSREAPDNTLRANLEYEWFF